MKFHEFGDPLGVPCVFFMGTPQKGEAGVEFSELARGLGVRLICPTRPWYDDTDAEPSFDVCSHRTVDYLRKSGIAHCHVLGGSGGGPFALHVATQSVDTVRSCYLLASMGTPEVFVEKVTSPPTVQLLTLFRENSYDAAMTQLGGWGLPQDLAHGAWADFRVLLGSWESFRFEDAPPVYIHHGAGDENAPLDSVMDLSARLPTAIVRMSPHASHSAIAVDEAFTELATILGEIASRDRQQA